MHSRDPSLPPVTPHVESGQRVSEQSLCQLWGHCTSLCREGVSNGRQQKPAAMASSISVPEEPQTVADPWASDTGPGPQPQGLDKEICPLTGSLGDPYVHRSLGVSLRLCKYCCKTSFKLNSIPVSETVGTWFQHKCEVYIRIQCLEGLDKYKETQILTLTFKT